MNHPTATSSNQGPICQALYPDLKVAKTLITGGTRGLGLHIAKNLATQGGSVFLTRRKELPEHQALKEDLLKMGASQVEFLTMDLAQITESKETISQFIKEFGPINKLVNNAGMSKDQLLLRCKESDLDAILDTNLKGPILLTSILCRQFLGAQDVSIVNISSIVGLMGNTAQTAYSASKAGLIGFTKSVAKEFASKNMRCNAVCPGFIETDMTKALAPETREHYLKNIPLGAFGQGNQVAELVSFLLSAASSYLTGEVIKIDGGLYI